ncbi:hypothetical protein HMPREF3036_00722 [Sutterella sp. KLE1602]|nr:hypothetical protein HMPREF3036_00722 [Sutterella sp. KLE1602]
MEAALPSRRFHLTRNEVFGRQNLASENATATQDAPSSASMGNPLDYTRRP